jgi:hypothetical protein
MSDLSHFESRKGHLSSTACECFTFVTDLRNFERFVPQGTITNWQAEKDWCSFMVSVFGTVSLRIIRKEEYKKVVFNGDALKKNDFELILTITGDDNKLADVIVSLYADLNPMMKMIAAKPIAQFLEMLIDEMEKFRSWKETKE